MNNTPQAPVSGYGTGRGYPDVAVAGIHVLVRIAGQDVFSAGTSVSAPVVAGFISNLNAARMAIGKGSVGYFHPVLYANSALFTNDITSGNILCPTPNICCSQGFYSSPGWDPASGLGSLNYGKMKTLVVSLGTVNSLSAGPTFAPTQKPIRPTRAPTSSPTIRPTPLPSAPPTLRPTSSPSFPPTRRPTRRPTQKPTSPTVSPTSLPSVSPTEATTTAL